MSKRYIKVPPSATVMEALKLLNDKQQTCALVVDHEDFLDGLITVGDIRRMGFELSGESCIIGDQLKSDVCLHVHEAIFPVTCIY
jgi:predicted transcriptional regulator